MSGAVKDGVPPLLAVGPFIERAALDGLLEVAASRRICVVTAAAGWGKTTVVAPWSHDRATMWLRCDERDLDLSRFWRGVWETLRLHVAESGAEPSVPELGGTQDLGAVAAVCGWLHESLRQPLVCVLDDLQELAPGSDQMRLVEGLCWYAPQLLHLVLVSRRPLPFSLERVRGQGLVADVGASELAFDVAEVARLLRATVGEDPPGLAARVWERTGGWPAALQCAVEMLRATHPDQRLAVLERLTLPGERLHDYLAEEVIGAEQGSIQGFLRGLSVFGEVDAITEVASGVEDTAQRAGRFDPARPGATQPRARRPLVAASPIGRGFGPGDGSDG